MCEIRGTKEKDINCLDPASLCVSVQVYSFIASGLEKLVQSCEYRICDLTIFTFVYKIEGKTGEFMFPRDCVRLLVVYCAYVLVSIFANNEFKKSVHVIFKLLFIILVKNFVKAIHLS